MTKCDKRTQKDDTAVNGAQELTAVGLHLWIVTSGALTRHD